VRHGQPVLAELGAGSPAWGQARRGSSGSRGVLPQRASVRRHKKHLELHEKLANDERPFWQVVAGRGRLRRNCPRSNVRSGSCFGRLHSRAAGVAETDGPCATELDPSCAAGTWGLKAGGKPTRQP